MYAERCRRCGSEVSSPAGSPVDARADHDPESPTKGGEHVDAGFAAVAPRHGTTSTRSQRGVVPGIITLLISGAIVAAAVNASRDAESPQPEENDVAFSEAPAVDYAFEEVQRVVSTWNATDNSLQSFLYSSYMGYGPDSRCWAGFSADFPDLVLVTLIWPSGRFTQFDPATTSNGFSSVFNVGDNYQLAGLDPAAFDANGYSCSLNSDGSISI